MADIYHYENGEFLCEGLQGSDVCDDAINAAVELAAERDEIVVLEDDDGNWLIHPDGTREPAGEWA